MKNVLSYLLKIFLGILTLTSIIVLTLDLTIYSVRDVSEQFLNEKEIKKMLENINILDLLKDENGKEIKEAIEIKNELISAGIPAEMVEEFINSKKVKELTSNILSTTIDYVVYDKKIEIKEIKEDEIYNFIEQNIYEVVKILKEKNVPKSEELTEERIQKVLIKVKEETPIIKQEIQKLTDELQEKIKETEQYKTIEDYKNELNNTIYLVRFIYSDFITNLIITIGLISIILIILSRFSYYTYLKWIGLSLTMSSILLYIVSLFVDLLVNYKNEIPFIFQKIFETIIYDSKSLFINKSITFLIIGMVLIAINIVIAKIIDIKEDKKIDL